LGVRGTARIGVVYERNRIIGPAKLSQLSIGFQADGQAYREVIFFKSNKDLYRFKNSQFEFSARASAVAITDGVPANVKNVSVIKVFTIKKSGLI